MAAAQAEGQPEAGIGDDEAVACADEVGPGQVDHSGRCPGGVAAADVDAEQAAGLQHQLQSLRRHAPGDACPKQVLLSGNMPSAGS